MIREYLVTFHTNFGAQSFNKYAASVMDRTTMRPIPRELSSSCGTCVVFATDSPVDNLDSNKYDLEKLYEVNAGQFNLVLEFD